MALWVGGGNHGVVFISKEVIPLCGLSSEIEKEKIRKRKVLSQCCIMHEWSLKLACRGASLQMPSDNTFHCHASCDIALGA